MAGEPVDSRESSEAEGLAGRRGIIFILSAPSGAGKTTLSRGALKTIAGLEPSISITTREPRENETEGVDYHFVSEAEFDRRLEAHEMAESAVVFEARYGTPRAPLDKAVGSGRDIVLDIDIQGARQIRKAYPNDAVTIFVLPPNFDELESRLRGRATEDEAAIVYRLNRAREEARAYREYQYLIVNNHVGDSLRRLKAIVQAERLRTSRLRGEFAPWQ